MPYFITDKAEGCPGWATIKADGEIVGCHQTKAAAIKQMVAISLAEKMKPGGERALNDELEVGDFVFWENAGQTEYGLIILVSTYGVVTDQLGATVIATQDRPIAKISVYELVGDRLVGTDRFVIKSFAPLTKLEMPDYEEDHNNDDKDNLIDDLDDDMRIDVKVPAYMRAAARRGLQYVSEGKAGDGLKQQTINEARKMAAGEISDDKWIRMAAWIARHLGDLDSPEADPQHPNYPSAGVVAHLLWGSGPSKTKARAAMEFAQGVVERIRKEEERHLAGKHDQSTHGKGGSNEYIAGNWKQASNEEKAEIHRDRLKGLVEFNKGTTISDEELDAYVKKDILRKLHVEDADVYFNGPHTITFQGTAKGPLKISEKNKQAVLSDVDDLQTAFPKKEMNIAISDKLVVEPMAYGYTTLGGFDIKLSTKAINSTKNVNDASQNFMPTTGKVPLRRYTIAHEWGHTIDIPASRYTDRSATIKSILDSNSGMSNYGKTKTSEAFAEGFADFFTSGGKSTNPATLALAKEFKWQM